MTAPAASSTAGAAKGGDISLSTKLFYGFGSPVSGVEGDGFRALPSLRRVGTGRRLEAAGALGGEPRAAAA